MDTGKEDLIVLIVASRQVPYKLHGNTVEAFFISEHIKS